MNLLSCADNPVMRSLNIENLWNLETIGIGEPLDLTNHDRALNHFNKSVSFENGRYYIKWPWRYETPDLPRNFDVILSRLKSLARRSEKDRELLTRYNDILQDQMK